MLLRLRCCVVVVRVVVDAVYVCLCLVFVCALCSVLKMRCPSVVVCCVVCWLLRFCFNGCACVVCFIVRFVVGAVQCVFLGCSCCLRVCLLVIVLLIALLLDVVMCAVVLLLGLNIPVCHVMVWCAIALMCVHAVCRCRCVLLLLML